MDHTTFAAVSKCGHLFTRSSKTMEYTHAVLRTYSDDSVAAWSWHKTKAAAQRMATNMPGAEIVDVIAMPYNSQEAKTARAGSENTK